jgi:hypothetical protein
LPFDKASNILFQREFEMQACGEQVALRQEAGLKIRSDI